MLHGYTYLETSEITTWLVHDYVRDATLEDLPLRVGLPVLLHLLLGL